MVFGLSLLTVLSLIYLAVLPHRESTDDVIRVYCAASLRPPIKSLIKEFNRRHDSRVEIVRVGGSGELAGQIKTESIANVQTGADLYLSADGDLLMELVKQKIVSHSVSLATQRPVIAIPANSQFDPKGLSDLIHHSDIRFGIASPRAAIGKLTRSIADSQDELNFLETRKSLDAENVMVLGQALLTGSLDAAVVWDTTVLQINRQQGPQLRAIAIEGSHANQVGEILAGVISSTQAFDECSTLCQFLATDEMSRNAFEQHGFKFASNQESNR